MYRHNSRDWTERTPWVTGAEGEVGRWEGGGGGGNRKRVRKIMGDRQTARLFADR